MATLEQQQQTAEKEGCIGQKTQQKKKRRSGPEKRPFFDG